MVFITKANSIKILRRINISDIDVIEGNVYKMPIYFLSKWETKNLLLMRTLLKDPEKFTIEYYKPLVNKDTFRYVFESQQSPSYHSIKECNRLHSKFKNFEVPFEIKSRAKERASKECMNDEDTDNLIKQQVNTFRRWFGSNIEIYRNEPEKFLKILEVRWNVKRKISEIEMENSGIEYFDNLNLNDLEAEIDNIIRKAGSFFNKNEDKKHIIRRFQKLTFLAYTKDGIRINDTELSDTELKEFLRKYDQEFKRPIKKLLLEYYRVKYNPELSFDGNLLERLNFRQCASCNTFSNK